MGLNWQAALDRVSQGMGRIAEFQYGEFLRVEQNKAQERRDELAHQREMNRARFMAGENRALATQNQEFQRGENAETRKLTREQIEQTGEYQMESLANQRAQIGASAASHAADAAYRTEMLAAAKAERERLEKDRAFQQSVDPFKLMIDTSQAELKELNKQLETNPNDARILGRIGELEVRVTQGIEGVMNASLPRIQSGMSEDQKARLQQELLNNPGQSISDAIFNSLAPEPVATGGGSGIGGGAIDAGSGSPTSSRRAGASGAIGGTSIGGSEGRAPVNLPSGLRIPGMEPEEPYTVGGTNSEGDYVVGGLGDAGRQVIQSDDEVNITSGASMAAGDAALGATGMGSRDVGPSMAVGLRKLSAPAQMEVSRAQSAADLSEQTINELVQHGYNPETFIGYFRRSH